ncbi:hypothetical protein SSS_07100 [Sarcoptes scabiei]|uniref:Uncharacterized protein n=1 Tax=Sarcoptes scabiei TaxID=52283 RepID=A0A834R3A5_SARSC|nr:hypothetical protein SSS_07100 [Sarcoptes scabiei]
MTTGQRGHWLGGIHGPVPSKYSDKCLLHDNDDEDIGLVVYMVQFHQDFLTKCLLHVQPDDNDVASFCVSWTISLYEQSILQHNLDCTNHTLDSMTTGRLATTSTFIPSLMSPGHETLAWWYTWSSSINISDNAVAFQPDDNDVDIAWRYAWPVPSCFRQKLLHYSLLRIRGQFRSLVRMFFHILILPMLCLDNDEGHWLGRMHGPVPSLEFPNKTSIAFTACSQKQGTSARAIEIKACFFTPTFLDQCWCLGQRCGHLCGGMHGPVPSSYLRT